MAVKIRLKRLGKIRSPHYRIVVIDSRAKRDGRAIEEIGKYHPKNDPSFIEVKSERAQYWLGVGAQPTEAVVALFKRTGDWQTFSGDTSPSGVEPQKEKKNRSDAFNVALADAKDELSTEAISKPRKSDRPTDAGKPADTDKPADKSSVADKPADKSSDADKSSVAGQADTSDNNDAADTSDNDAIDKPDAETSEQQADNAEAGV